MNIKAQMKSSGFMPREIAVLFLTSKHSKTASFRKRCFRALEQPCTPLSRSTAFPISAPKTGAQRLQARLRKATAEQLHKWSKRTLRRANRLQDQRAILCDNALYNAAFGEIDDVERERIDALLVQKIAAHDGLIDVINVELTKRSTRGKGLGYTALQHINPPPLAARDSEGGNTKL